MFLEKYLRPVYLDIVYNNYDNGYLKLLDEDNFNEVYNLLKRYGFYFIDDIIIDYIELFNIDSKYVEKAILDIKTLLGDDYIKKIGNNMVIINKIIEFACKYCDEKLV